MARIPKRLAGPSLVTNAAATVYTVPATTKTEVRHIHVQNPSGSTVNFTMSIGTDAASKRIYDAFPLPTSSSGTSQNIIDNHCFYVLEATEVIQVFANTNNVLVITIDGVEIVLG